jgi:Rab-GTPase-TBC domain
MERRYHKICPKKVRGFSRIEWESILKHNDFNNVSKKRLKDSLLQGIPVDLRGDIWAFLTRANQLSSQFSQRVYSRLLESIDENVLVQIEKDLHRTFPEQKIFQEKGGTGQQVLNNILCAYANYDPEVGYCQGMGFIVGCLIIQIRHEELAFWAFVQIMHEYNWRLIFK